MDNTKIVFISYSWDNIEHENWVLNLANKLVENGIDVYLDKYDLSAGKDANHFMEKASIADKIIMILTPNYKKKADKREGGVGYEYSIISQEIYENSNMIPKVIPVLRKGEFHESAPVYVKSKIYHDLKDDVNFQFKFFELIKLILDKPLITKPSIGALPNFETGFDFDIDKKLDTYILNEELNRKKYALLNSSKGVEMFRSETKEIYNNIENGIKYYKENFKLHFTTSSNQYASSFIISTINFTFYFAPKLASSNFVEDSYIKLNFFRGPVGLENLLVDYSGPFEEIYMKEFDFKLDDELTPIWINRENKNESLTTNQVHKLIFREVISNDIELKENLNK